MTKINQQNPTLTGPLTVDEIKKYIDRETFFGFELEVARHLDLLNIHVEHGGLYDDSSTGISREFDLRAHFERPLDAGFICRYLFAIECKRISPETPLIIQTTPRRESESFHEIMVAAPYNSNYEVGTYSINFTECRVMRKNKGRSIYKSNYAVGKSVEQLNRTKAEIDKVRDDSKAFNKWSQALASLHDQVSKAIVLPQKGKPYYLNFCLPLLIVPNDCMWTAQYQENGMPISDPVKVDHCEYFVGKRYVMPKGLTFDCSHLEICTFNGFKERLSQLITYEQIRQDIFDVLPEIKEKYHH